VTPTSHAPPASPPLRPPASGNGPHRAPCRRSRTNPSRRGPPGLRPPGFNRAPPTNPSHRARPLARTDNRLCPRLPDLRRARAFDPSVTPPCIPSDRTRGDYVHFPALRSSPLRPSIPSGGGRWHIISPCSAPGAGRAGGGRPLRSQSAAFGNRSRPPIGKRKCLCHPGPGTGPAKRGQYPGGRSTANPSPSQPLSARVTRP
jgi:hypothetical protein